MSSEANALSQDHMGRIKKENAVFHQPVSALDDGKLNKANTEDDDMMLLHPEIVCGLFVVCVVWNAFGVLERFYSIVDATQEMVRRERERGVSRAMRSCCVLVWPCSLFQPADSFVRQCSFLTPHANSHVWMTGWRDEKLSVYTFP